MNLKYLKSPLYPAIIKSFTTLAMILSLNMVSFAEPVAPAPPAKKHAPTNIKSSPFDHKAKHKNTKEHHYKEITEAELQRIIDNLPDQDKSAIAKIKEKIAGWPDEIFAEVSNYNEFLVEANRQAAKRYQRLSPAAKQALTTERELKNTISPNTVAVLSEIHVERN